MRRWWILVALAVACDHVDEPAPATGTDAEAIAQPAAVDAPRSARVPTLDGRCNDLIYRGVPTVPVVDARARGHGSFRVVHTGVDAWVCVAGVADGFRALDFTVDPGPQAVSPAAVQFHVDASGAVTATRPALQGLPLDGVGAAAALDAQNQRGVELRIPLDWLGGYERVDRLRVAVTDGTGRVSTFPRGEGFGGLRLLPVYDEPRAGGAAFLDGRGGHLVVPFDPALQPREITIEGWVKVVDGDCGTLLGNGRAASYWVGLCHGLRHASAGPLTEVAGQIPLADGWHHLAVAMSEDGERWAWVDGELDVAHFESEDDAEENEAPVGPPVGASDRMLRIGTDGGTDEMDALHAYVHELHVWDRVLGEEELRTFAFQPPPPGTPGLVARWPFETDLRDVAGGHDAGRVGDAALARARPDVQSFPVRPEPPPYQGPPPAPPPAWDAVIPRTNAQPTIDGACMGTEYAGATFVALEPERTVGLKAAVGADGLYLCLGPLLGAPLEGNGVVVSLRSSPQGGPLPGPADLQLRLVPDGQWTAATGNDQGFFGPPPQGLQVATSHADGLPFLDDVDPVQAPVWTAEAFIPASALPGWAPGGDLALAVGYAAALPPDLTPQLPNGFQASAAWPEQADPRLPATWGAVQTEAELGTPFDLPGIGNGVNLGDGTTWVALSGDAPGTPWPRSPPTTDDFDDNCPDFSSDPPRQLTYFYVAALKWPLVDSSRPWAQAEGVMQAGLEGIKLSNEDSWPIHGSHDLDMHITPRPQDRWVALNGGDSLVLETESGGMPDYARPAPGDHVTAIGRWIFDCGHSAKSELHPVFAMESDHEEVMPQRDGRLRTFRRAKVWFNPTPNPILESIGLGFIRFNTPIEFDLALPSQYAPWMPFGRVLSGPADHVAFELRGDSLHVTVTPSSLIDAQYFEIVGGYVEPHADWKAVAADVYQVHLDTIDIVHDHDDKVTRGDGDWYFELFVNGQWHTVWAGNGVKDSVESPGYEVPWSKTVIADRLQIGVSAYEGDSPGDDPAWCGITGTLACFGDDELTTGMWTRPLVSDVLCASPTGGCADWEASDWGVYYSVVHGGAAPPVLANGPYWDPRLADEPDEEIYDRTFLGAFAVPGRKKPALAVAHRGYVTEAAGPQPDAVRLLGADHDDYAFTLDDFADVDLAPLPAGLVAEVAPAGFPGWVPADLRAMLGYKGARIEVHSVDGARTDVPYDLRFAVSWRELPPDPGEGADLPPRPGFPAPGRLVDLATPAPETYVAFAERELLMPWAWLHVAGDVDLYDVALPPVHTRPDGQPACQFDEDASLVLYADDLRVRAVDSGRSGTTSGLTIPLAELTGRYAGGHVMVQVRSADGHRAVYRFDADFHDGIYLNPEDCERRRKILKWMKDVENTYAPVDLTHPDPRFPGDPAAPPGADPIVLPALGGYEVVELDDGGALDALVSSPAGTPVVARLFDTSGVLVAEGAPLADAESAVAPGGLVAQSRLSADGLAPGPYLVQVEPATAGAPTVTVRLGVNPAPR